MARKIVYAENWWPVYEMEDPDDELDDENFASDVPEELVARYERIMGEFRGLQLDLSEILSRPRS